MKSIVISAGDPAGCGPLITLSAINDLAGQPFSFIVAADESILAQYPLYKKIKKSITLIDPRVTDIHKIKKGRASALSGKASIIYLQTALAYMKKHSIQRLVTAPISKEAVQMGLPRFCGHTEYLAKYFKVSHVEMLMVSKKIKVALLTRHIDLARVAAALKHAHLQKSIDLIYRELRRKFSLCNPRIAFASVNPHAGLHTFMHREEKEIYKAITQSRHPVDGPYPSDSLFTHTKISHYDCILCAYHDQGMIPFKLLSFQEGANVTLGLPIVRTSPAHGVAFDAINKGDRIFHSAMSYAISLASRLVI